MRERVQRGRIAPHRPFHARLRSQGEGGKRQCSVYQPFGAPRGGAKVAMTGILTGLVLIGLALMLVTRFAMQRAEQLAPPLGQFRDVPGGRLHFTDQGSGRAVVLIHGLAGNLRNFAPELVTQLARNHRVIAVDRPGAGYSTVTGAIPDLHGQAAMVAALIEGLDLGPVTLAGHSLGGALSLALVKARPDLVASLALIAPLTQPITDVPPQFRTLMITSPWARKIVAWLLIGPAGLLAGRARQLPAFAPDAVPANFESLGGGALLFRPANFDSASQDAQAVPVVLPALAETYGAIACPTHVLFGRGDQILSPALHGELFVTQVAGARCDLVEGGHMLPSVHGAMTAQWIETVIQGVSQ